MKAFETPNKIRSLFRTTNASFDVQIRSFECFRFELPLKAFRSNWYCYRQIRVNLLDFFPPVSKVCSLNLNDLKLSDSTICTIKTLPVKKEIGFDDFLNFIFCPKQQIPYLEPKTLSFQIVRSDHLKFLEMKEKDVLFYFCFISSISVIIFFE